MADRWCALLLRTSHNKERDNMLWNISGSFFYAFASMVLSFLVMRIIGKEQGGIFSFGFSTIGQQMFILAYFGIRPFQVTDGNGQFRFYFYKIYKKRRLYFYWYFIMSLMVSHMCMSRNSREMETCI